MRFERNRLLFGEDFEKIQKTKILIIGVGGVGSFVLDGLYRSGVSNITIIDYDTYDETNQNRQIGSETIGEKKTKRLKELYPSIEAIDKKVDEKWVEEFDFSSFDIIVDACDTTKVKLALARKVYKKLIMSFGAAKRYDASKIRVGSIWKSEGDAYGAKIRRELKKVKFDRNFLVVYSIEEAKCKEKGSCVAATGAFGLFICSEVIKRILK